MVQNRKEKVLPARLFTFDIRKLLYSVSIYYRTHAHATDLNTTKMTENYDISSNETDVQKEYKSQTR